MVSTYGFAPGAISGIRWRLPRLVVDIVLAVIVTIITVWGCYSESNPSFDSGPIYHGNVIVSSPGWAYLFVAAAGLALIWRRRHPKAVLAASVVGVLAFALLGSISYAALVIPPIALYTVALTVPVYEAVLQGLVTLAALAVAIVAGPAVAVTSGDIALVGLVAVAVLGGIASANRRRYIEEVRARTELMERTHQEKTRRTVDAERLRIARELHDVVAHTMSTINVQAGVAAYVASDLPPNAANALHAIKTASKDGLRELRAILSVLRQVDEPDSNQPQPGLSRLDALVAGVIAAGLPTAVVTTGQPPVVLPPAVDLAAYRIVQESLTNAIRHAGPATATVEIGYGAREVTLRVTDTGWGPPVSWPSGEPPASGHGVIGMQERAAAAGGTLDVGRARAGGFEVTARLPLEVAR
ncbi:signal transduction histidine kinase [Kutzneria buriramensis]|uniref:histidine kinase n=1 Tax=Kutzneria buriramensis TaxID=1045776 RepID=A0A3E0HLD5_9PSEU|nr:signal transduction histidine kinase [Kutzneria buriramensis]